MKTKLKSQYEMPESEEIRVCFEENIMSVQGGGGESPIDQPGDDE